MPLESGWSKSKVELFLICSGSWVQAAVKEKILNIDAVATGKKAFKRVEV